MGTLKGCGLIALLILTLLLDFIFRIVLYLLTGRYLDWTLLDVEGYSHSHWYDSAQNGDKGWFDLFGDLTYPYDWFKKNKGGL
jgi:hypothetical protein